jgi:hypothetical protein
MERPMEKANDLSMSSTVLEQNSTLVLMISKNEPEHPKLSGRAGHVRIGHIRLMTARRR